jgi:non-specific serine/threonine protein kinase/serine/threonine-protein kinase
MSERRCPACGATLNEAEARTGTCPSCILRLALEGADLDPPVSEPAGDTSVPAVPSRIGPYRLLEKIGEGGMGEVWLAEQTEGVRRRVALKIIKQGMDTKQVLLRFEAERQALALMDHPHVAKVFDAGSTPEGRPFFAMEHVDGAPITDHCDQQRLTMRQRLDLFLQVCEGVQHAHQKAIIHRDLKPSNVLVTLQDAKPVVKIIDFGVAKATAHRLTERTLFTELGLLIGTPEYMSPEQIAMSPLEVDTRTDVYSLGVLLYELLVGTLPFEPEELRSGGFDGIRRTLREREPRKPSARLGTLGGERSIEAARLRRTDVAGLRRRLSGDLDWITMKTLEKDRARRYGSPAGLAADIRRHLAHEPVQASPPGVVYRVRKFVRRRRLETAFGVLVVLGAVAFMATLAVQAARISREAKTKARVTEFLTDLFKVSDPSEARGQSVTARELLDKGAAKIRDTLGEEPEVQAELMATMGAVYVGLGLYTEGEPLLREALEARRRVLGPGHPATLTSMNDLADAYRMQGRYTEAEALHRETLEMQKRVLGTDHSNTLSSMNNLGMALSYQGRYSEAEALHRGTLEMQKRVLGPDHPETLASMSNLAVAYYHQDRFAEAEALFRETLDIQKQVLGPDHPHTLVSMGNLALMCSNLGRHAEAEALHRETLEIKRRVQGPDHPETLKVMNNLALGYYYQGRYAEAEALHRELLGIRTRLLGADHPDTLISMNNVAIACTRQGRYAEAEALHLETLDRRRRVLGPDHPETINSIYNLGGLSAARGQRDAAFRYLREAVDHGYSRADWMLKDQNLASIRDDPDFQKIVASARENQADSRRLAK